MPTVLGNDRYEFRMLHASKSGFVALEWEIQKDFVVRNLQVMASIDRLDLDYKM